MRDRRAVTGGRQYVICFDGLRSVTTLSVFVRLACAFICGGIIGIERSYKRRPAGFRTHILICIGAAITTLTSQYLYLNMHYFTDMARLGRRLLPASALPAPVRSSLPSGRM